MNAIKVKIYVTLLIPFILSGIGLLSIIHYFKNGQEPMQNHFYLLGILLGILMWFFEVRIIFKMIVDASPKNSKV